MKQGPAVSITLPKEVRYALVMASTEADPRRRARLIDEIIERAKLTHPQFFQCEGKSK